MYARPFWVLVCPCHLLDWLHNRWIKSWNWQAVETWVPWRIRPCHYHSFARVARSKFWPQFPHLEAILLLKCTHSKVSERMSRRESKKIVLNLQICPMDLIDMYGFYNKNLKILALLIKAIMNSGKNWYLRIFQQLTWVRTNYLENDCTKNVYIHF